MLGHSEPSITLDGYGNRRHGCLDEVAELMDTAAREALTTAE